MPRKIKPLTNETMLQFFHWYASKDGNHWKQVAASAENLSRLGITAVWLPPACKGREGIHSNGYDIYDLYDLGEFNQKDSVRTKWGGKDEYLLAIAACKKWGINTIADIVLNHKAGADATEKVEVERVNPANRNEVEGKPFFIEAFTQFSFPGRAGKYSPFTWEHTCFSGVDYDNSKKEKGIFRIVNSFGDQWQEVVGDELGNFDYLMFADIEFRNKKVSKELKRWGKWFLKTTGVDGFRLDAVKHMSPTFISEWLDSMRKSKRKLFAVGEYWAPADLPLLCKYLRATGERLSLFDAALHYRFYDASQQRDCFDLRSIFDSTLVKAHPKLAVTIVDNHDTQPLQEMDSMVAAWFKPHSYALILLRKSGYPCLFYPDLYGATYTGKGKDGVDQEIVIEKTKCIEELLLARKRYAYGKQTDYFQSPNCIGWTRKGDKHFLSSGTAVIMSNGKPDSIKMNMGQQHAGKVFIDCLGNHKSAVFINKKGWGIFPVEAGSVSAWVSK